MYPILPPVRELRREGEGGDSPSLWDHAWHNVDLDREVARYTRGRDATIRHLTRTMPTEGVVLEAGCGSGRVVAWLRSQGVSALGMDFAAAALAEARAREPSLPLIAGDVARMPFPDNSLDGIVSLGVIEHFQDGPAGVLGEHLRVLKPGRRMFITVPRMSTVKRWEDRRLLIGGSYRSWRGLRVSRVRAPATGRNRSGGSFYQYEFPDRWILSELEGAGFQIVTSKPAALLFGLREFGPARSIITRLERVRGGTLTSPKTLAATATVTTETRLLRLVGAERPKGGVETWILDRALSVAGHILMVVASKPHEPASHA